MTAAGLALGTVGTDVTTGQTRFTMGIPDLVDGIGFMPLATGLFGLLEIIATLASPSDRLVTSAVDPGA
jgi:putative tricarboxylic transport membrane protein